MHSFCLFSRLARRASCFILGALMLSTAESTIVTAGRDPLLDDGDADHWSAITVLTTPVASPPDGAVIGTATMFNYWVDEDRASNRRRVRPLLIEKMGSTYRVIGVGALRSAAVSGLRNISFDVQSGTDQVDLSTPNTTYHVGVLQYHTFFGNGDSSAAVIPFGPSGGAGAILDNVSSPYTVEVGDVVSTDFPEGPGGRHYSFNMEFDFPANPVPPNDIALSEGEVFLGMPGGSDIATISVADVNEGDTHTLSLVTNPGGIFQITGDRLRLADGAVPTSTTYNLRIRATDSDSLSYEKDFSYTVEAASAPSDLTLSSSSVSRDQAIGSLVSLLSSVDANLSDMHSYQLVAGAGDDDNGLFSISGRELRLSQAILNGANSVSIRVQSTDLSGLSFAKTVTLQVVDSSVRINEFLASNETSLQDVDGDFSDWIELFNEQTGDVPLGGWYLTDDPDDLMKWEFPDVTITPQNRLIVFASGKNRRVAGQELHTNFTLSGQGEFLALVKPDGTTIASQFFYDEQFADISFGRAVASDIFGYMVPTPDAGNGVAFEVGSSSVGFSHERGFYNANFQLSLSANLSGSTIRYTLDGSIPSAANGLTYSGPITISPEASGARKGSRIIRAIAINADAAVNLVGTHTYLFINQVVTQSNFETDITNDGRYGPLMDEALLAQPTLSIVGGFPGSTEELRSVEFFDPDGLEPGFQIDCGVKVVGGTSVVSPKPNFRFYFRNEYGASKLRYPLFKDHPYSSGATEVFDRLNLRGGAHDTFFWLSTPGNPGITAFSGGPQKGDAQYIRNRWINDMQLRMGNESPHGRWVQVYINGAYHGQYQLHEWPNDDFFASYLPGGEEDHEFTNSGNPDKTGSENWQAVWQTIKTAAATDYNEVSRWIDVENFADYMLLNFYAGNPWDWRPNQNWMAGGAGMPDSPRGKWKFICWDSDVVLQDPNANVLERGTPDGLFELMIQHEDFRVLFRDRAYYHCFNGGALTGSEAKAIHDFRADEVRTSIIAETARWQGPAFNPPWDRDGEWQNELNRMVGFFNSRTGIFMNQLRARDDLYPLEAPEFDQRGGMVELGFTPQLTAPEGDIYYTIDGSDPRLPGGAISLSAIGINVGGPATVSLIGREANWKYLADGTDQGTAWRQVGFNDSSWPSGQAELGYGENDEATDVGFVDTDPVAGGTQKNITTYFRYAFSHPQAEEVVKLIAELKRDDGAVVYLNGQEIHRVHLPAGSIDYLTEASISAPDDGNNFNPFDKANGTFILNAGVNVLAVEIHQKSPSNSDISFDFSLQGELPEMTNGLEINEAKVIKARVFDGTTWSPINEAAFTLLGTLIADESNIAISEIHYNPDGPDDTEFIEIQNTAQGVVDLSGVQISGGLSYIFPNGTVLPPGGLALIVEDESAFRARYEESSSPWYQPSIFVSGQWSGGLANEGEALNIISASGQTLFTVDYSDGGSWPGRADGKGSSLEFDAFTELPLTQPEQNDFLIQGSKWRPSSEFHGSPGRIGLGPDNRVVFNEILANTDAPMLDALELANTGSDPISIGGWYLSDDSDNHKKFKIPDGTTLGVGEFLTYDESDFNAGNAVPFALSGSKGDDLFLLEADAAGSLLRFVDRAEFGASASGESFGLWPGGNELYPMVMTTLGESNLFGGNTVRVGSVVVSEIHYNPDGADLNNEFIQITNTGSATEDLTNWRLRGEVDFDFAPGTQLPASESIIIVDFDPANAALRDAFVSAYSIDAASVIVGPWNDNGVIPAKLSDGGGAVRLQRPDALVTPTDENPPFYPMLIEDLVNYDDDGLWPLAADGTGSSLRRISENIYGDDPMNWMALSTPLMPPSSLVYDDWADSVFPVGATAQEKATTFDYDGDGILNFAEFVFLLDPTSSDSNSPMTVRPTTGGLELVYRRRTDAPQLAYVIKASEDLQSWDYPLGNLPVTNTTAIPGGEIVTVTLSPLPVDEDLYFRVEVSR